MAQVNLSAMFINHVADTHSSVKEASGHKSTESFHETLTKAKEKEHDNKVDRSKGLQQKNKVTNDDSASIGEKVETDLNSDKAKINQKEEVTQTKEKEKLSEMTVEETQEVDTEEAAEQTVEEQVLALVSQMLNLSAEEVQSLLDTLQLSPQDLITPEGFGKFISNLYGEGDMANLLTQDVDMKKVNELFDALAQLKEAMPELVEIGTSDVQALGTHASSDALGQGAVTEEVIVQQAQSLEEVNIQEASNVSKVVAQPQHVDKMNQEIHTSITATNNSGQTGATDIGMTVPIQNFTSTTFSQTYTTDLGTITQTTITKQVNHTQFVLEQVDFKQLGQMKELNVNLSPKELGNMQIKIIETNGALVAEINVENEKTKAFILNEIQTLKDNLSEQGLNVSEVKVDIRQDQNQSHMERERQKSSKRIQEIINSQYGEEEVVEVEEKLSPVVSDSEVDYMV